MILKFGLMSSTPTSTSCRCLIWVMVVVTAATTINRSIHRVQALSLSSPSVGLALSSKTTIPTLPMTTTTTTTTTSSFRRHRPLAMKPFDSDYLSSDELESSKQSLLGFQRDL